LLFENPFLRCPPEGTETWAFETKGVGTSPAVVDGTVYVGSGFFPDEDGIVYALDASDGTEQWTLQTSRGMGQTSPAVVDGTVYLPGAHLYAVGSERGTPTATETPTS
jgi:outer membrane protein assembly factor BamB